MTIHDEHPFVQPDAERDPVRRLRGRLGGTVSLWTTSDDEGARAGLTVSSFMVAAGEPAHILALLDPESDFAELVAKTGVAVVQLLGWEHRNLADAFAGQFPAPGGPFRLSDWTQTPWGPRLTDATAWAGVRTVETAGAAHQTVGWSELVDGVIEHVEIGAEGSPLVHRRGRYQPPPS